MLLDDYQLENCAHHVNNKTLASGGKFIFIVLTENFTTSIRKNNKQKVNKVQTLKKI